jgi:hypothetical protein
MTKTLRINQNERITATKVEEIESGVNNLYKSEDGRYWEVQKSKFLGMMFIPVNKEWAENLISKNK